MDLEGRLSGGGTGKSEGGLYSAHIVSENNLFSIKKKTLNKSPKRKESLWNSTIEMFQV